MADTRGYDVLQLVVDTSAKHSNDVHIAIKRVSPQWKARIEAIVAAEGARPADVIGAIVLVYPFDTHTSAPDVDPSTCNDIFVHTFVKKIISPCDIDCPGLFLSDEDDF